MVSQMDGWCKFEIRKDGWMDKCKFEIVLW